MTCTAAMNGAASVRYKDASEINTPISEMAQYNGFRCATTAKAQPIASPANRIKRREVIMRKHSTPFGLWKTDPAPSDCRDLQSHKQSHRDGMFIDTGPDQISSLR